MSRAVAGKNKHLAHSHAHEEDIPGTVNLNVVGMSMFRDQNQYVIETKAR